MGSSKHVAAFVGVAVLTVGIGSAIAAESEPVTEDVPVVAVGADDEELTARLLELEPQIPAPLPTSADLAEDGVDALLTGSFTSSRSTFDALEDDLRSLFVDGDDATTAVGDAVSAVAHGLLLERQAMLVLEETDASDQIRPLDVSDTRDDRDNAIDADGLYGREITALNILDEARELQVTGYDTLADLDVEGADVFADRYASLVSYEDGVGLQLREVAGRESEQLLVEIDRYDSPIGIAHSVGVTYVCVNREAYMELADAPVVERLTGSVEVPDADCRESARVAGLSLSEQVAVDELMDGVETAVGTG